MHEDFERHERNDKIKWIATAVAFLLVFVLIISLFALLFRSNNSKKEPEQTVKVQMFVLAFDDEAKRTSYSEDKQVWEDEGIVFINLKGSGTAVKDYYDPIRLYAHSTIEIEREDMTEVIFYCMGSTHARNLQDTLETLDGIAVSVRDFEVTVVFDEAVDTFEVPNLVAQVQLSQIAVKANVPVLADEEEPTEEDDEGDDLQSMIVTDNASHNMSLMVVRSVEPLAANVLESVTITATVKPDNTAENTGVDWSIKWKNASSSWATGKTVTDYVTVTPKGSDYAASKTATLNNLQPFGEQIVVTATARDNPSVTASCNVDYAQKATNFSLSFGTVNCNFGGKTNVTVELNERGTPTGGTAKFTPQMSSVYTIATDTTVEYKLSVADMYDASGKPQAKYWLTRTGDAYGVFNYVQFFSYTSTGNYESVSYNTLLNYSVANKGLYFGIDYMRKNMGLTFSGGGMGSFPSTDTDYTPASLIEIIEGPANYEGNVINYTNTAYDMFTLTVTVKSSKSGVTYATLTKSTDFHMSKYTNTSTISSMEVSDSSYVF